jgi:murein DD-endopeptidase MepM/ murein hydrolase activator NlpD
MKGKSIFIFLFLIALLAGAFFYAWQKPIFSESIQTTDKQSLESEPVDRLQKVEIISNDTYQKVMNKQSISSIDSQAIYEAASSTYDLATIKTGKSFTFFYRPVNDEFYKLAYQLDSEEELFVTKQADGIWLAERKDIPYEIKIKTSRGSIKNFLYADALEQGVDEKTVIAWAETLQWSLDFAMDVRVGDTYTFIYEERFLNGEYVMPGKVLAAKYVNQETPYYAFYYKDSTGLEGHYDQDGNNVQKMFLKAPVAFKYISSGFTTGARYIQAFNISTGHRAIDYAANYGNPIQTVGDGTVSFAGRNGSYGNMVKVRHNGTYSTNYGHMSKIAVKVGQHVVQGETIGYVGSTGLSTGPHVHYEMVKNGVKINPLKEVLPPGEPLTDENKADFFSSIAEWQKQLARVVDN